MRRLTGIFIAAALSFCGCTLLEEAAVPQVQGPGGGSGAKVKISFNVAVPVDGADTKAIGQTPSIDPDGFYVAVFGANGFFNEWVHATVTDAATTTYPSSTATYTLSATLSPSDSRLRLHLIANCPVSLRSNPPITGNQDSEEYVMDKIRSQRSDTYNDGYWQKIVLPIGIRAEEQTIPAEDEDEDDEVIYVASEATLAQFPDPIVLVRNFARVYLHNLTPIIGTDEHQLVTIKRYGLAFAPSEGTFAPLLSGSYFTDAAGIPIDTTGVEKFYNETFLMRYQRYSLERKNPSDTLLTEAPFYYTGYSPADQAYDYYSSVSEPGIPPDDSALMEWDADHPWNNVLYLYERTVPSVSRRATRIIIKAERRDQYSTASGDAHSEGDKYYALDIVNSEGVAIPILRNQTYTVHLLNIEAGSGESTIAAAAKATSATVSGDPAYQDLTNISDGKSSIEISVTEMFYVRPQTDSVMFRYIPTNVAEGDYTAGELDNDLVSLAVGSVNTTTGVFTELTVAQASSAGVLTFATDADGYKVWIVKNSTTGKAVQYVRSNNRWVEATAAQIADSGVEKWGMIKYELNSSFTDADGYFSENRVQAIHVTGSYGSREMSRNIVVKVAPRQSIIVSCQQKYVLSQAGAQEVLRINIPSGLSRSMFPLEFTIEPEAYSLTPNGDVLPVDYGTSTIPGVTSPSFYFIKTLTRSDYEALPSEEINSESWRYFDCNFKTTLAQSACTVYVGNRYFNTAGANDDFYNFQQRLFTSLTLPSTVYRGGNLTFTYVMDAAHSSGTHVWWDPENLLRESTDAATAFGKSVSATNRVLPPSMTVTLVGLTPQLQEGSSNYVTTALSWQSGNTYRYNVYTTGAPTSSDASVSIALTATGAAGAEASVTLSTANLTDNPLLYAENSVSTTIQGAEFRNLTFSPSPLPLGLNQTTDFSFTYVDGLVEPVTLILNGLALNGTDSRITSNGNGTYTFTPTSESTLAYTISLKSTTRFSSGTVYLQAEDYNSDSATITRATSFTIPANALYLRNSSGGAPTGLTTGTDNNATSVYLNNSPAYSYLASSRYSSSYLNNSAQTVTLSNFSIVDDDAPVYFIYRTGNNNNTYYYAKSSLSALLDATSSSRVTLTFNGIMVVLTPTSTSSVTSGQATVSFARGSGNSNPGYWSNYGVGLYPGNTATITVSSGYVLTAIVIQEYTSSTSYNGMFTVNTGTVSELNSSTRQITWTPGDNNTTSVVFTSSGGGSSNANDIDCTSFTVSYEAQ